MQFTQFIRQPFAVEAIEITEANIDEIAKLIGHVRVRDGVKCIAIDRRIVPNVNKAYIGWFLTRLNDNYRCYARKVFKEQFLPFTETLTFEFEELGEEEVTSVS